MATLHMDVEIVRDTKQRLNEAHGELTGLISRLNTLAVKTQAAWLGNSATEFFTEFDQFRTSMNQLTEALGVLNTSLGNEITEWENMAAKLA